MTTSPGSGSGIPDVSKKHLIPEEPVRRKTRKTAQTGKAFSPKLNFILTLLPVSKLRRIVLEEFKC